VILLSRKGLEDGHVLFALRGLEVQAEHTVVVFLMTDFRLADAHHGMIAESLRDDSEWLELRGVDFHLPERALNEGTDSLAHSDDHPKRLANFLVDEVDGGHERRSLLALRRGLLAKQFLTPVGSFP